MDKDTAITNADVFARQADNALDAIDAWLARILGYHNVTPCGRVRFGIQPADEKVLPVRKGGLHAAAFNNKTMAARQVDQKLCC